MALPDRIGKYLLQQRLGGESLHVAVFKTVDDTSTPVVIKVFLEPCMEVVESAALKPLKPHPHVVETLTCDFDEVSGCIYLIQEFVPGPTLGEATLTLWHRVRCGLEAALAIEHLHSIGISCGGVILPKHFRLHADGSVRLVHLGNAYSGGLPLLPDPGQEPVRASAAEVKRDIQAFGSVLCELISTEAEKSVTLRSILEYCVAENPKQAASLHVVITRLQAWIVSYTDSTLSQEDKQTPTVVAKSLRYGQFEKAWTYGVLALSLAAMAGGTVGSQFDLSPFGSKLKPAGLAKMVLLASGLRMDRTEVSNAEFIAFAHQTHRILPSGFTSNWDADLPVGNVTAQDADAYCAWMGKHLPTEIEWLQAAKIAEAGPAQSKVVAVNNGVGKGPLHLLDNAAEWVSDRKLPDLFAVKAFASLLHPPPSSAEEWRRIKGGSYLRPRTVNKLGEGIAAPARYSAPDVGFRCVVRP